MIKKIGFLIPVFMMLYSLSIAQENFTFKQAVLPNSIYKSSMQTIVDSEMIFGEATGMEPTKSNGITLMSYSVISGDLNEVNIPVEMEYDSLVTQYSIGMSDTPIEMVLFKGTKIYGSFGEKNAFSLDTIIGDIDETQRTTLTETLKQFSQSIMFPEASMKIGEDFNQEIPFTIPVPGQKPLEVKIKTNYKLIEIKKGIAYFDLIQEYIMESNQDLGDMTMTGEGKGKLEFDIENSFAILVETISDSDLKMKIGEMEMNVKSNTHTKIETEYSKK